LITRSASSASTASDRGARLGALVLALALAAAAFGCRPSDGEATGAAGTPPGREGGGQGRVEEASSLFAASDSDPSLVEFETNDDAYLTERGYTLWALKAAAQDPFDSRMVVLNKAGGCDEAGYGLVFCHGSRGERMLVAMINAKREYIVGEAAGSEFATIVPWTACSRLKGGYNQDNVIGLKLDAASRRFALSINGDEVCSFAAIEPDYGLGGGNGYLVVISPRDRFPDTPVSVSFREE
jgi:hypothetical protein